MAKLVEVDEIPAGKTYKLSPVAGAEAIDSIGKLPRQLGLTGRYLAEGLADTAGIFADPLAAISNKALGTELIPLRSATSNLLDRVGVPSPNTPQERVIGDASRMLVGTGGFIKGAGALSPYLNKSGQAVATSLSARPDLQAASAIGAGYAGGTARENGAGAGGQVAASLIGGLGLPITVNTLENAAKGTGNYLKNTFAPQQIDVQVDNVLKQSSIDLSGFNNALQQSIRDDVRKALSTGSEVSPDAIRRLADYRSVGATPMRGNITLNPVDITRDKNLAKLGANSSDAVAQQLPMLQNRNNAVLIDSVNGLGTTTDDAYAAGTKIIGALDARDKLARGVIGEYYNQARNTQGRAANLDTSSFTQKANNLLDDALLGGKLPGDVRNLLNKTATGEMPLTVDVSEQLKTRIGELQRATNDMAERKALSLVRSALDDTPLLDEVGQESINAFNKARGLNRAYMGLVEKTPALQAVRDGVNPDKFVNDYIIGNGSKSSVMDVAMLKKNLKGNKEATEAIKGQIIAHLKGKALSGNADEVANFSPSGFNSALKSIGDRKLKLFFDDSEIEQLKRIGRVASYENFQPKGSAVNNSNTASNVLGAGLDLINKYVPFGQQAMTPVNSLRLSMGARNSLSAPNALTIPQQRQPLPTPLFPILGMQGLLSAE
jgi:hypothetical protein